MSKYSKKLKDIEYKRKNKRLNKEKAIIKKQLLYQSTINDKSTKNTFLKWLDECGRDLGVFEYSKNNVVLSCSGSDGPTIGENSIDGVPYNNPEALDKWLEEEGLYEPFDNEFVEYNNPPSTKYLDWFKAQEGIYNETSTEEI